MQEIYNKLNDYLNDICMYLEKMHPFLIEHIDEIARLNDAFLNFLNDYSLESLTKQNHLTYVDVYFLARKIIEQIDQDYLVSYDKLIENGELDFSYDCAYYNSACISIYKNGEAIKNFININREFNYNDVRLLVHEFIHSIHGKKMTTNGIFFSEFLSIYFELYATDFLLKKGINPEEIEYLYRIRNTKQQASFLSQYELVLLSYIKFGNLGEDSVSFLQKYILNIQKEDFEKECITLYQNLRKGELKNQERIEDHPKARGSILAEEFIALNYKYVLGTFLALYARKYCNFNTIVDLNNHIHDQENKTIFEICSSIGIDLKEKDFSKKLFMALEEYLNTQMKLAKIK